MPSANKRKSLHIDLTNCDDDDDEEKGGSSTIGLQILAKKPRTGERPGESAENASSFTSREFDVSKVFVGRRLFGGVGQKLVLSNNGDATFQLLLSDTFDNSGNAAAAASIAAAASAEELDEGLWSLPKASLTESIPLSGIEFASIGFIGSRDVSFLALVLSGTAKLSTTSVDGVAFPDKSTKIVLLTFEQAKGTSANEIRKKLNEALVFARVTKVKDFSAPGFQADWLMVFAGKQKHAVIKPEVFFEAFTEYANLGKSPDRSSHARAEHYTKLSAQTREERAKEIATDELSKACLSNSTVCSALGGVTVYFVKLVDSDTFACSNCRKIADEPVTCGSRDCAALFCSSCLNSAQQLAWPTCPRCSSAVVRGNSIVNLPIKNLIQKQEVFCIHSGACSREAAPTATAAAAAAAATVIPLQPTCAWRGKLSKLGQHLTQDCQGFEVRCQNVGCPVKLPRYLQAQHGATCAFGQDACKHCAAPTLRSEMAGHVALVCQLAPVPCTFAGLKCTAIVERGRLPAHMDQAAHAHTALLVAELHGLKERVAMLEAQQSDAVTLSWKVQGLAAKMAAAREAEQMWFSADFFVPSRSEGMHKMFLSMRLTAGGNELGLYFHKRTQEYGSSSDCDVDISGWQLTLSGAGAQAQVTRTSVDRAVVPNGLSLGWRSFCPSVRPFVAADDSITITATIKPLVGGGKPSLALKMRDG